MKKNYMYKLVMETVDGGFEDVLFYNSVKELSDWLEQNHEWVKESAGLWSEDVK